MITEWLLDAVEAVLSWLAGLFPVDDSDDPFTGWGSFVGFISDINYFLPISELFTFTLAFFVGMVPLAVVSLFVWLAALIRGGSARG